MSLVWKALRPENTKFRTFCNTLLLLSFSPSYSSIGKEAITRTLLPFSPLKCGFLFCVRFGSFLKLTNKSNKKKRKMSVLKRNADALTAHQNKAAKIEPLMFEGKAASNTVSAILPPAPTHYNCNHCHHHRPFEIANTAHALFRLLFACSTPMQTASPRTSLLHSDANMFGYQHVLYGWIDVAHSTAQPS